MGAGRWLAWGVGLERKPKLRRMAHQLKQDNRLVAACLMITWSWADAVADHQGFVSHATLDDVDQEAGIEGFGKAMVEVGWLQDDRGGLLFPAWSTWNLGSAKARALAARRQRKHREGEK